MMGSGVSRHLPSCFCSSADEGGESKLVSFEAGPLDETLGHSFCYVRSSTPAAGDGDGSPRSSSASAVETAFKAISGASVSANSSAAVPIYDNANSSSASANARSHFRSSSSFSAIPLQLAGTGGGRGVASGPLDRGFFLSGPIERGGALSGPLDSSADQFSGPLVKKRRKRGISGRMMVKKASLLRRSLSEKNRPWVFPLRSFTAKKCEGDDGEEIDGGRVQWAHGKAGEDRVHVVVSESQRWLFVGIYDGFNGPEAPEFLLDNLYKAVYNELKGLFWEEVDESEEIVQEEEETIKEDSRVRRRLWEFLAEGEEDGGVEFSGSGRFAFSMAKLRSGFGSWRKEEKPKVVQEVRESSGCRKKRRKAGLVGNHGLVLRALERALEVTENAYLEMTERAMDCNPELAVMGSCLLVVLMRDDDVYVMNLGDSRAIVAQYREKEGQESCVGEIEVPEREAMELVALQLSTDHSTSIEEVSFSVLEHDLYETINEYY